jgi:hypothetical protein
MGHVFKLAAIRLTPAGFRRRLAGMKSAGFDPKERHFFGQTNITLIPRNSKLPGHLVTATHTPKTAAN